MKRHMALILSALVWLACPGLAGAVVNEWSTAGPANIHAIAVDPWDPGNVLAVTETGEVFRSADAGGRWVPVVIPRTASGGPMLVRALAFDPRTPGTAYAAGAGVTRSTDGGQTWITIANTGSWSTSYLVIDPQDPRRMYGASRGSVLKSRTAGSDFESNTIGLENQSVVALAIDPATPSRLYAGSDRGVFRSEDHANGWTGTQLTTPVAALAVDPANPNVIYAATTRGGFFVSRDYALSWSRFSNIGSSGNDLFQDVAVDPVSPGTIYVASGEGIFKTTDSGATWTASVPRTLVRTLRIDPSQQDILYAGTTTGINRSTDGAATWSRRNAGLFSVPMFALAIDPQTPAIVHAAGLQGVFKSTDRAGSWTPSAENSYGRSIVIDPSNSDIIYLAGGVPTNGLNVSSLSKSVDGGATWNRIESGLSRRRVRRLAINPLSPTTLYAGMAMGGDDGYGFFKTTDGGITWTAINRFPNWDVSDMVLDPRVPDTIYAAQGGVHKSTDGGVTWTTLDQGALHSYAMALAVDPQTSTLYVGRAPGLIRSNDGDGRWTAAGLDAEVILCVAVSPRNSQHLYVGTYNGVFVSQDGGGSWSSLNTGLDSLTIQALAIDPEDPTIIHAATGSGVYTIDRNSPPVASAGADQFVKMRGPGSGQASLDASGSSDPDGDTLSFSWSWAGGRVDGARPTVDFPLGTTDVTLAVSDSTGAVSEDTVQVTVCRGRGPLHPKGCNRASDAD